jgi:hypothetical protein
VAMIAIKQRNKRPFQEIENIRDALNKGNNKITELRIILQRESQNS